jgi:hypothetical protein
MLREAIQTSDAELSEDNRRRENREPAKIQLEVIQPQPGKSGHVPQSKGTCAWSRDVSASGVCFRTLTRLETKLIRLQQREGDGLTWTELEIVRERRLPDGLWEYGATLREPATVAAYDVSQSGFLELMSALQDARSVHEGDASPSPGDQAPHRDSEKTQRSVLLSLRKVANSSALSALATHRFKRRRRQLRMVEGLLIVAGAALLGLNAMGDMVPPEMWYAFTAAASVAFAFDWHIACHLPGATE